MDSIGRCSKCGAICLHCRPRSEFSLIALPEVVRPLVREVLNDVHASQHQQDALVFSIMHLDPEHIIRAKRIWDVSNCARQGKGYGYFRAICLRCADEGSKDTTLDGLPPLITEETNERQ